MSNALRDFEWFRCPEGFCYATEPRSKEEWIFKNGLEKVPYRPFDEPGGDDLYLIFAKIRSREELLKFVQRFGPLTQKWSIPIEESLKTCRLFNVLMSAKNKPKRQAAMFTARMREQYSDDETRYEAGIYKLIAEEADLKERIGTTSLIADPHRGVRIQISPETFLGALWWQLGERLSGNINFAECRQCGHLFEAGPGTGRHSDAEFCCNKHKVRFFSLARSKRKRTKTREE